MLRAFKTPPKGLGDKALQEFDEYCSLVEEHIGKIRPGASRPSPLDILIAFSSDDQTDVFGPGAPLPSETIATRPLKLLTAFSHQMKNLREKAYEESLENIVAFVVQEFDLLPYLDKISKTTAEFEERKANVQELQKATQKYANSGPALRRDTKMKIQSISEEAELESPLGTYLDDVALVTDMADQARESEDKKFKVCLMTIHGSKGMEFDSVYVVGNEEGTFPTSQAIMEGDGSVVLEEEKRLCYVAMTRAKTELVLTWRKEVPIFTSAGIRTVSKNRSRFLDVLTSKGGKKSKSTEESDENAAGGNRGLKKKKVKRRTDGTNSVFAQRKGPQSIGTEFQSGTKRSLSAAAQRAPSPTKYQDSGYSNGRNRYGSTGLRYSSPRNEDRDVVLKPKRREITGTQSVFARKSLLADGFAQSQRQRIPNHPASRNKPVKKTAPSTKTERSRERAPEKQQMDSSWFFPVGSKVKHTRFGEGIVLAPPMPKKKGDLPVLVQFPDGERREFCARGTDLTPILT